MGSRRRNQPRKSEGGIQPALAATPVQCIVAPFHTHGVAPVPANSLGLSALELPDDVQTSPNCQMDFLHSLFDFPGCLTTMLLALSPVLPAL
jgi:hypothetical protein